MAEEEAARAFLELQVDDRVSGAAAVSWVAGHPRFAALSRPARAKAWSVADSNDSGALDGREAFATFVKELDDAATASDASTPVAAAAAAGLVVGGPPGAVGQLEVLLWAALVSVQPDATVARTSGSTR